MLAEVLKTDGLGLETAGVKGETSDSPNYVSEVISRGDERTNWRMGFTIRM